MALPSTIEEVIVRLEQIVLDCKNNNKREGYFAALYLQVTREVSLKIKENYFNDNKRMEQLDVVFANRYIKAHDQYLENKTCTSSWLIAFKACKKRDPLVVQHLLIGINAHIGLDLGIAAATVCPGPIIESLHNDFNKINAILSGLVNKVEQELSSIWPLLKIVDWVAGKMDEKIASFSMNVARDAAWATAIQYTSLQSSDLQEEFIIARDKEVAIFGEKIATPGVTLSVFISIFQAFEWGTIKKKIEVLNDK
jgi:hypothetical protein